MVREKATVKHNVDFTVEVHNALVSLVPVSDFGRSWFHDNLGGGGPNVWLAMDLGKLDELATLITGDGLKIGNTEAGLH